MNLLRRLMTGALALADSLAFLAPLLTRLVIGGAFFFTGRGKLMNFARTVGFFTDLGIPFPKANAAFVSSLELVGGICLVVGLGTRLFAFLLAGNMAVALMTADKAALLKAFPDPASLTDVTSFVYLLFLLWLVFYGAGAVSVDRWLGPKLLSHRHSES